MFFYYLAIVLALTINFSELRSIQKTPGKKAVAYLRGSLNGNSVNGIVAFEQKVNI